MPQSRLWIAGVGGGGIVVVSQTSGIFYPLKLLSQRLQRLQAQHPDDLQIVPQFLDDPDTLKRMKLLQVREVSVVVTLKNPPSPQDSDRPAVFPFREMHEQFNADDVIEAIQEALASTSSQEASEPQASPNAK